MALRELLLPWDAQPQEVAPPAIDLGPDALLWSAAHPQLLIGAANRLATSEGSPLVRPGPLGMARAWSRNASAGALFGTFQHVTGLEVTAAVVAAPVASANRKIAWSQRTSGSNAAQFVFGFNIDGSTSVSALSGGISLVSRNTSGSGGELGASSQFDGLPHAWVLANGANEGYIYRDGVAQTVSPNYRAFGTVWTSAQATAIGNIGDYTTDGAFVSDDPIYLVIVWPRVLPADQARRLSADLARNLGPAFEPRRIHVPVAAGGGGTTVALSGISATFAQTAPAVSSATPLVGESVTANAGILLPAFSRSLSGQAGTAFAGTLNTSTSRALSGQSAAFTAGSVIPSVAIAAIGLQATFASGTLTASSSSGTTVNLVGEPVAFAQTAPSVNVTIALTGIAATMASGLLSASSGTAIITVKAGSWLRYKKLQ